MYKTINSLSLQIDSQQQQQQGIIALWTYENRSKADVYKVLRHLKFLTADWGRASRGCQGAVRGVGGVWQH